MRWSESCSLTLSAQSWGEARNPGNNTETPKRPETKGTEAWGSSTSTQRTQTRYESNTCHYLRVFFLCVCWHVPVSFQFGRVSRESLRVAGWSDTPTPSSSSWETFLMTWTGRSSRSSLKVSLTKDKGSGNKTGRTAVEVHIYLIHSLNSAASW